MSGGRGAEYWIEKLQLKPHPEGGCFRETWRAALTIPKSALPPRFNGARSASTAIYFLLRAGEFSALHRLAAEEIWHFYAGSPLVVHVIEPGGRHVPMKLGADAGNGEQFQCMVPGGCWFGARLEASDGFALVGCTVAPGFDFGDFEMADRDQLTATFPEHRDLIHSLTRAQQWRPAITT